MSFLLRPWWGLYRGRGGISIYHDVDLYDPFVPGARSCSSKNGPESILRVVKLGRGSRMIFSSRIITADDMGIGDILAQRLRTKRERTTR